jgi:hypothetical protein
VPPSRLLPNCPPDLETICLKCLQKDPRKRYAGAADLAEDLRRFQAGEPIAARPVGRLERGWRWCRRDPVVAGLLAAVVLVLLAGTGISTFFAIREGQQAEQARKDRDNAVAAGIKLEKANDELKTTVVLSWLRPLELEEGQPLTDQEIDALWELATSGDEGLRLRFVQEALRSPRTTRQLQLRAEPALQAVVGLDPGKWGQVERLLGQGLQALSSSPDKQRDVALTLAQVGIQDAALAGKAAATLSQAMSQTTNQFELQFLAQGLAAVAAQMEPKEAAGTAAALTRAMSRTTNPQALRDPAQGLSAVLLRQDALRSVQRRHGVAGAVGVLSAPGSVLGAPALLQPALEPLPPPLPAQTLVDILKQPLCVGEARRLVLDQLQRHYQRPFADQWDFVRFAQERQLPLDLTTPPQRPALPASGER